MIPKRIALKNFLSFGELDGGKPVEIAFDDDEHLCVLGGANGTGKSAVFDAITYALYGEHRGGKIKAEQLIRHGANGFEVEFEFEFNGIDYRIRRTRPRKGRTTQHLQQKVHGEWKCVRGTDAAGAVDANDIKGWVTETIGLGYDAFTNSVLLRQGQADKLFSASRDDRIEVLKGIIGFEQFEALSGRVNTATRTQWANADLLSSRLADMLPVSDDDLATAEAVVQKADDAHAAAQCEYTTATERVGTAGRWEKLEQQRITLDRQLAEADERQRHGRQIRQDKATLDDLTAAVPVLENLFRLRVRIARFQTESESAKTTLEKKTAERDGEVSATTVARQKATDHKTRSTDLATTVKDLSREIGQDEKFLKAAEAVAELDRKLADFPKNLDEQRDAAIANATGAALAVREAEKTKTEAETKLTRAKADAARHADATIGAICSHCRQPVDAAHAATARAELAAEVARLQDELAAATTASKMAAEQSTNADSQRVAREKQVVERDKLCDQKEARRESLGPITDPAALRELLATNRTRMADAEREGKAEVQRAKDANAEADKHDNKRIKLDGEVTTADGDFKAKERELTAATVQEETARDQLFALPGDWQARLKTTDAERVRQLAAERDSLVAANVSERFKALEQDDVRRDGWQKQRADVIADIDAIPEADRVTEAVARTAQTAAKLRADEATATHTAAVNRRDTLVRRREEHAKLTTDSRMADEQHRLHARLDKLLGNAGLQLKLTDDAQEQILAFANDTLQNLSDGDLSLEVDTDAESTKAFDLRARRGGGEPIGVAFLSGSQRFRVAVSIALAVGRFACDRARRLEAVIIDEGFGSLDPEGLQAMAAELKCLQQKSALRRIVLVSHQPEFTEQFPSRYLLTAGPNGTIARRVPR